MSFDPALAQLHAKIHGSVQGVGFRSFVFFHAGNLALTGWVRNVGYNMVEVCAEGKRQDLEQLLEMLREGPSSSSVENVECEWMSYSGVYFSFELHYSI